MDLSKMLYPGVGPGERNKRLQFGKNPDHIMDTKKKKSRIVRSPIFYAGGENDCKNPNFDFRDNLKISSSILLSPPPSATTQRIHQCKNLFIVDNLSAQKPPGFKTI